MQIKKGVKGNLLRTLNIGGLKMQNLIIYQNSVIAPVANTVLSGCSSVEVLAREKTVWVTFWTGDKVTIEGRWRRTRKVPAKALKSGDALINWMKEVINKAWN